MGAEGVFWGSMGRCCRISKLHSLCRGPHLPGLELGAKSDGALGSIGQRSMERRDDVLSAVYPIGPDNLITLSRMSASFSTIMDDDQPATAETIIHALSQFGAEQDQHQLGEEQRASDHTSHYTTLLSTPGEGSEHNDLGGLSRGELEAEVLKLRGLVYQESASPSVEVPIAKSRKSGASKGKETSVDIQTGKRVERERRTELYKAIRQTVSIEFGFQN